MTTLQDRADDMKRRHERRRKMIAEFRGRQQQRKRAEDKKAQELEELKAAQADLLCSSCNTLPATINEQKVKLEYCDECKRAEARLRRYDITLDAYQRMLARQHGSCAICDKLMETPHVDQCPTYGHVPGLLCGSCNTAIGMFHENQDALLKAVIYLSRNRLSAKWCSQDN